MSDDEIRMAHQMRTFTVDHDLAHPPPTPENWFTMPHVDVDLQPGSCVVCSCGTVWKFAFYQPEVPRR